MRLKRLTALISSAVMVFSLLGGIGPAKVAQAEVTSELPMADGIYVTAYVPYDWDTGVVSEDKDQNGNTVLVDESGEWIHYRDDDGWYLYDDEITNGRGIGIEPQGQLWFDYVSDGKKVTHLPLSKLTFTRLDGSPCEAFSFGEWEMDKRAIQYSFADTEPVLVTYKGAEKNNRMVLNLQMWDHFFTTPTKELGSYIYGDDTQGVVEGGTKDFYFIAERDPDDGDGLLVDPDTMLSIYYYDEEKNQDVRITDPAEVAKFATASWVSDPEDHKNVVIKVTVNGVPGIRSFQIDAGYRGFNISDPSSSWHEGGQRFWVDVCEANSLLGLNGYNLTVGGGDFRMKSDDLSFFAKGYGYQTVYWDSITTAFKFIDAEGNESFVTNPEDLTFYYKGYDEATDKEFLGDKVTDGTVTALRHSADSPLIDVNYAPNRDNEDKGCAFTVGYKDIKPDVESGNYLDFYFWDKDVGRGFFYEKKANSENYATSTMSNGLAPITLYLARKRFPELADVKCAGDQISLVDEEFAQYGDKVSESRNAGVTFEDGAETAESWKIVIPAGVLKSDAKLTIPILCTDTEGNSWTEYYDYFIFHEAPGKGTTFTKSGVTYKFTGASTLAVSKVKTSATKVTIPAKVYGYKVTSIAAKAMNGCKKLKTITVKSTTIKSVGKKAFNKVPKKAVAKVPKSKKKAYKKLFKKGGFKGTVK